MSYELIVTWEWIVIAFSSLSIAVYTGYFYRNKYKALKETVHLIHSCIETIDDALTDDSVSKEEFFAAIKKCLRLLEGLI